MIPDFCWRCGHPKTICQCRSIDDVGIVAAADHTHRMRDLLTRARNVLKRLGDKQMSEEITRYLDTTK